MKSSWEGTQGVSKTKRVGHMTKKYDYCDFPKNRGRSRSDMDKGRTSEKKGGDFFRKLWCLASDKEI